MTRDKQHTLSGARYLVDAPGLKCQSACKWRALRLEEGFDSRLWLGIGGALSLFVVLPSGRVFEHRWEVFAGDYCVVLRPLSSHAINAYKHIYALLRDIIRQEDVAWGQNTHGWCHCALAVAFIMARCNREREGLGQRQTDTDQNTHAD
jgi:hypothetical protein